MSQVSTAYVARQPILDQHLDVAFYELLHRSEASLETAQVVNQELATSELLVNSLIEIGLERIVGQQRAFINLSREHVVGDWPLPLDPKRFGLELLENEQVDQVLIDALRERREQGFLVVLDDFVYEHEWDPMLHIAHIVKLDVAALGEEGIRDQHRLLRRYPLRLLAEKVETAEEFELCRLLGFDYFQGYFFARPELFSATGLRASQTTTLQLLSEVQDPDISLDRLEEILAQDVALSYKLLRYINSAFFNLPREFKTIRQALVYLGLGPLRVWVSLMIVVDVEDRPHALKQLALTRAKFCQCLAERMGREDTGPYFTAGLFSTLDALLGMPMDEVLHQLPLDGETKAALMTRSGPVGSVLRFAIEHERGQWEQGDKLPLSAQEVNEAYAEAVSWSEELLKLVR